MRIRILAAAALTAAALMATLTGAANADTPNPAGDTFTVQCEGGGEVVVTVRKITDADLKDGKGLKGVKDLKGEEWKRGAVAQVPEGENFKITKSAGGENGPAIADDVEGTFEAVKPQDEAVDALETIPAEIAVSSSAEVTDTAPDKVPAETLSGAVRVMVAAPDSGDAPTCSKLD